MKKIIAALMTLLFGVALYAQPTCASCTIRIEAAGDVHNGAAPGDPAGFIDGSGKLDVSGMAAGSLIYFDVILEDFDFNLAGYQYQINYPANLAMFSEDANDWINGTGAIVTVGAAIAGFPVQQLPATLTGDNAPATVSENSEGKKPVGVLLTDPLQRPQGSVATPNAGGVIMRMCLMLNPNNQTSCNSFAEPIRIRLVSSFSGPQDDIFANENAERVTVATGDIQVLFGDPSAPLRGDANNDGVRDFNDTLAVARCTLFGEASPNCNWTPAGRIFDIVFDYNCDGVVDFADTLGIARLSLGLQNRSAKARPDYATVAGSGVMVIDYAGQTGAMVGGSFETLALKVGAPYLDEAAQRNGWAIVHENVGGAIRYALFNAKAEGDMTIPKVKFSYETLEQEGRVALTDAFNQKNNLRSFSFQPQYYTEGVVIPNAKETPSETLEQ